MNRVKTSLSKYTFHEIVSVLCEKKILIFFIDETESEKVKEKILSKCKQYLDRAEKISEYLNR